VSLRVQTANGRTVRLGSFSPGLVNQALAFATDPRPVALTMLNAPLIERKQVLIHPALINTVLGRHVAEADEWIFRYTDPAPPTARSELGRMMDAMRSQAELYSAAFSIVTATGGLRGGRAER